MKAKLFLLLTVFLLCQCSPERLVIDGNFADWDVVPSSRLAQASADANSKYKNLYNVKFCTDTSYIFFYLEFNGDTEVLNIDGEDVTREVVWAVDFFMNVDGDAQTGGKDWLFDSAGADVLLEGSWTDNFAQAGVHVFPPDSNQNAWAWQDANVVGAAMCCDPVTLANGHKAVEGKISLAKLPVRIKSLNIGVLTSNAGWVLNGLLPQVTVKIDGSDAVSPMLDVPVQ
ncbi:MAG: hypothetical protein K6A36_02090 [Paludibacteraceae bacterium]|nr:hypothetical protein [Paludibacteraceae bacterium]